MTLTELINAVYEITKRPDQAALTSSMVKQATLKAHHIDYFWKDIFETGVQFSTASFIQNLDYRSLIPTFRAIKYLRKYDYNIYSLQDCPGKILDLVVPETVTDSYHASKTDIYYVAGPYIQIRSSTAESRYLLGCYVNPILTDAGYNSWIALDHPYVIINDAASRVFKAIGKDEEASIYQTLRQSDIQELLGSNIVANGF